MKSTAIIGAGAIAYCHADALQRLDVGIVGVMDVNPAAANAFAARYNVPVIKDLAAAVQGLDMVHICTPPAYRIDYARVAMEAGCHVIMEKPMAISIADGTALVALAARHNVQLVIDFNHRFRAGFQELLNIIRAGEIGEVVNLQFRRTGMLGGNAGTKNDTWRRNPLSACGMAIESLSHDIDMLMQLAGPVTGIKADVRFALPGAPNFDTDVNALLNMRDGAMASLQASWSSCLKASHRLVIGTKGAVALEGDDLFNFNAIRIRRNDMKYESVTRLDDIYSFQTCPSYYNANRHFIECLVAGRDTDASGAYALETLKISHAILNAGQQQGVAP